jgi:hypothetical protein
MENNAKQFTTYVNNASWEYISSRHDFDSGFDRLLIKFRIYEGSIIIKIGK